MLSYKCPYCLRKHTNKTVTFDYGAAITVSEVQGNEADHLEDNDDLLMDTKSVPEKTDVQFDDDDDDELGEFSDSIPKKKAKLKKKLYTAAELYKILGKVGINNETRWVTDELIKNGFNGMLLKNLTVEVNEGKYTVKKILYRCCACGKAMGNVIGSIPSYTIMLMGTRSAGKTTYLISLFRALKQGCEILCADGRTARVSVNTISHNEDGLSIAAMSSQLFDKGILPDTTKKMDNEPLHMTITVKFSDGGEKKALLFLRDMPGENFTATGARGAIRAVSGQFAKLDGYIVMLDPETFEKYPYKPDDYDASTLQRFNTVVTEEIVGHTTVNKITQPSVAIITKGDELLDDDIGVSLKNENVDFGSHIRTTVEPKLFTQDYFDKVIAGANGKTGTKGLLELLSYELTAMFDSNFKDVGYFLVSALSDSPIKIIKEQKGGQTIRRVETLSALKPWRVADPVLWLLIQLGILPALAPTLPEEDDDEDRFEDTAKGKGFFKRLFGG